MRSNYLVGVFAWLLAIPMGAEAALIHAVAYESLSGTEFITFDDIAGGPAPGTNYDAIFVSGGASFGERFDGQTNTPSGGFDVLGGTPGAPLVLVAGAAGANLNVFLYSTNVLTGLGPLGFPNLNAIGEGAFAVLFTTDQSEFGFQLVGGNGGRATVDFFRRDGSLVDRLFLDGLGESHYGFRRDLGLRDIAGISIFNVDESGVGFDNLKHDVASGSPGAEDPGPGTDAPGPGTGVSEPGTLVLLSACLACVAVARRGKAGWALARGMGS